PAFVLSQDQTLHKKISQTQKMHQPTLQAGTSPTNWLKNHHKQHNIVCNWQNKKLMICSIKNVAIIP
ncbi:hypothetical protein, partial [Corynebacterium diphtheriae]|uniref:hypothetical protein n=1 Tax=Corynebacterium diphtheriae TaxID=1717 RepID=UPI00202CBC4C